MTVALTLYHGTSAALADSIEVSGFQQRNVKFLSFGDGAYFYREISMAKSFAEQEFKANACVLEIEISVPKEKIRAFPYLELDNFPSYFNKVAIDEGLYVIDASKDDGIFVVRPEALHLIRVVRRHA